MRSFLLPLLIVASGSSAPSSSRPLDGQGPIVSAKERVPGFDATGMDHSVLPGNDFFRYANGAWEARTTIPADSPGLDRKSLPQEVSARRTSEIIMDAARSRNDPGSIADKIGTMYSSFMDERSVESAGSAPLHDLLGDVQNIKTRADLAATLGKVVRRGAGGPFVIFVQQDLKNSAVNAAYMRQGGLGMPDRSYYLSEGDPKVATVVARYGDYVASLFRLSSYPEPDAAARNVVALEKALAAVQWTASASRDVDRIYNPIPVSEFDQRMPGFDWRAFLDAAGVGDETKAIVFQPDALAREARILSTTPLSTLRAYVAFHAIAAAAPYLSSGFVRADFDFNSTVISGVSAMQPRSRTGVSVVNDSMGQAVGRLYVAKYFSPRTHSQVNDLVRNLIAAMDTRLSHVGWLSPKARDEARAKLAATTLKIGYPEKWRDYSGLKIVRGDVLGNALRSSEFEYDRKLAWLGKPVDRTEWAMSPQSASAYASAAMNDIVFPAGFIQPPYFDPDADPAVNYGGLGAVIGHEISHNFDDRGSKFDHDGNFASWWTSDDTARFKALTDKLVAQYDAYQPLPDKHVDGRLTLSENIADLAGVNLALDAYHLSLHGKAAPVVAGLSGDQRFFLGFVQVYRSKRTEAELRRLLTVDPHTPENWRVNVVRNLDAWYVAFGVKPNEKLFLPPSQRVRIW